MPASVVPPGADGGTTSGNGHRPETNGKGHAPTPTKENPAPGAGPFGMVLFLISLGVLFLGSIAAYLAIRFSAGDAFAADRPPLPRALLLSTGLILASSVTLQCAGPLARANRQWPLRAALLGTLLLAMGFLASQVTSWIDLVAAQTTMTSDLYGWLFYFLTGLHALHVIGGFVPLTVITVNAFYGRYSPLKHGAIGFVTMYWHFLGVVWLTLYAMLAWA
ncbi:MAG: hypothetical protein HKN12_08040 [Gemmatimonadetes bacterium]|nr:hypothetical protein [Gemmatimonadota bacterium]